MFFFPQETPANGGPSIDSACVDPCTFVAGNQGLGTLGTELVTYCLVPAHYIHLFKLV